MEARVIERRQHRRVDLVEGQVEVRSLEASDAGKTVAGRTKNVSLAGCKALMPTPFPFAPGTSVTCTVNVPQALAKQFPFVKIIAKGWVVRVLGPADAPAEAGSRRHTDPQGDGAEVAVAIAFTGDVTTLATVGGY